MRKPFLEITAAVLLFCSLAGIGGTLYYRASLNDALGRALDRLDGAEARHYLTLGAHWNRRGELGKTVLMAAAASGDLQMMHETLARGADVNARDRAGYTALAWACWSGRTQAARVLVKHSADLNSQDLDGRTPLLWATAGGRVGAARLLLASGANPALQDKQGYTARDLAEEHHVREIVRLLQTR